MGHGLRDDINEGGFSWTAPHAGPVCLLRETACQGARGCSVVDISIFCGPSSFRGGAWAEPFAGRLLSLYVPSAIVTSSEIFPPVEANEATMHWAFRS